MARSAGFRAGGGGARPPATARALDAVRGGLAALAGFSGVINLLALTGSFYMLQVYDRVLANRSVPTLVALTGLAFGLFAFQAVLEIIRSRILVRLGARIDATLGERVMAATLALPLSSRVRGDAAQPLRDLDAIRGFAASPGLVALLDLFPWMPLYLGLVFLLHPWLGWLALAGALCLVVLTYLTETRARAPMKAAIQHGSRRAQIAEAGRRNAEALAAMGFSERLSRRWWAANVAFQATQETVANTAGTLGAVSRVTRIALQSAMLGLGAYLVILGQMSAGAIIAASIISARGLAPIEQAIAHWKGFVAARDAFGRLESTLAAFPEPEAPLLLPPPSRDLTVTNLAVVAPGDPSGKPLVRGVTFRLEAGQGLGIVGPSGSGKSSVVRGLVGVWPATPGAVRLDGAAIEQWSSADRGRHVGYLPQDIELFDGTVAENISRFDPEATSASVIGAAQAAGVHDLILKLPQGYETRIGDGGQALSAGQRQRIGLARALYGDPFLVVLDEPNSNLDAEGEAALTRALMGVRSRGGIAIVVAHRPSAVAALDTVLAIINGTMAAFGPKDEVLGKLGHRTTPGPLPQVGTTPPPPDAPRPAPQRPAGVAPKAAPGVTLTAAPPAAETGATRLANGPATAPREAARPSGELVGSESGISGVGPGEMGPGGIAFTEREPTRTQPADGRAPSAASIGSLVGTLAAMSAAGNGTGPGIGHGTSTSPANRGVESRAAPDPDDIAARLEAAAATAREAARHDARPLVPADEDGFRRGAR